MGPREAGFDGLCWNRKCLVSVAPSSGGAALRKSRPTRIGGELCCATDADGRATEALANDNIRDAAKAEQRFKPASKAEENDFASFLRQVEIFNDYGCPHRAHVAVRKYQAMYTKASCTGSVCVTSSLGGVEFAGMTAFVSCGRKT